VLTAQGKEGVFLITTRGAANLSRSRSSAAAGLGYTLFELADFNGDGHLDLVTANGIAVISSVPLKSITESAST